MAPAATANTMLTSCHGVRTWTATLGLAAQSSMRRYHTPTLSTSRPRLTALSANARRAVYCGATVTAIANAAAQRVVEVSSEREIVHERDPDAHAPDGVQEPE